jgi:hypothetical protein
LPLITENIADLEIQIAPLQVLIPDNQTARFRALQCLGEIKVDGSVKNRYQHTANRKHRSFLEQSRSDGASVAITPEYSTPWDTVREVVSRELLQPPIGSVWVLGCESITPEELELFKEETKENIQWCGEVIAPNGEQLFYGAAVYILHLEGSQQDRPKLCGIIQFKTHDMGGTPFERDNLIKGNKVYVLSNPITEINPVSIRLLTLICADSFNFTMTTLEAYHPYLVLHLQLNTSPQDVAFNKYRTDIYDSAKRNEVEILTLNWAEGTFIVGKNVSAHNGSMYCLQADRFEREPCQKLTTLEGNHKLGVHLRFSKSYKYSAYIFQSMEASFSFDSTKVSQQSPGAHKNRTGVKAHKTLLWDDDSSSWIEAADISDGIKDRYETVTGDNAKKNIYREKLVALTTGNISEEMATRFMPKGISSEAKDSLKAEYWHQPRNLNSFYLDDHDVPRGTLANLDNGQAREISQSLSGLCNVLTYIKQPENLPENFSDYSQGDIELKLEHLNTENKPLRHNLYSVDNESWGTVVDIGGQTEEYAQMIFDNIKSITKSSRVALWYTYGGKPICIADEVPEFTSYTSEPGEII